MYQSGNKNLTSPIWEEKKNELAYCPVNVGLRQTVVIKTHVSAQQIYPRRVKTITLPVYS